MFVNPGIRNFFRHPAPAIIFIKNYAAAIEEPAIVLDFTHRYDIII